MKWLPIKDFDGYFANPNGEILTRKRRTIEKVLKQGLSGCGYLCVVLMKNNKRVCKKTHRIIAETFIPQEAGRLFVNHKNGIKTDNRLENLEWCTRSENVNHALATGLIKKRSYTEQSKTILDDEKILTLLTLPKTSKNGTGTVFTNRSIAKLWNISESVISNIRNNKIDVSKMFISE